MTLKQFMKDNRKALEEYIHSQVDIKKVSYEEIRLWVLNDERLYMWARREGVRI